MTCEIPQWVIPALLWIAPFSFILSIDVMQRTGHDEINRRDAQWIQWLRRVGFIVTASNLVSASYYAATAQTYMFVTFLFLLVVSGTYSLLINDIALRLRRSTTGRGTPASADDMSFRYSDAFIAATLREIRELREDMRNIRDYIRLTNLHIEALSDDLNIRPERAKPDSAEIVHPSFRKRT